MVIDLSKIINKDTICRVYHRYISIVILYVSFESILKLRVQLIDLLPRKEAIGLK